MAGLPILSSRSGIILLVGAALLYVAARAATEAICRRGVEASAGRRALAHWIPIVAVVLLAMRQQQPEIALCVIFATSVGALSLGSGAVILTDFDQKMIQPTSTMSRRAWPLLVPAALLPLLAGLTGYLYWWHALIFALEGLMILWVWNARDDSENVEPRFAPPVTGSQSFFGSISWMNLTLAVILAGIGAFICLSGTLGITAELDLPTPRIVTTAALGPLLIMPMILTGSAIPSYSRPGVAAGTHIGVALLNLCCLLPLAVILHAIQQQGIPMAFPVAQWRVDSIILVLLAVAFLPYSQGKWRLGPLEGLALVLVYVAYVLGVLYVYINMKV